jgi:predicted CopG family antitoxin
MHRRVTIGLREDVYTRLRDKGRFGESFSDLVNSLLNVLEKMAGEEPQNDT